MRWAQMMRTGVFLLLGCFGVAVLFGMLRETEPRFSPMKQTQRAKLSGSVGSRSFSRDQMESVGRGIPRNPVGSSATLRVDAARKSVETGEEKRVELSEKLVHFDLKGAPPKVAYLLKLMPFLKEAGATGILMEYEDMFPYFGDLGILKNGYAYRKSDVESILDGAKASGLKVVPLVQTFGHMEWVLKHKDFADLREIFRYPQVTCPSNPRSLPLIQKILRQVVSLHPGMDTLHIGADEAYYVGKECERCRERAEKIGLHQLMLSHVSSVARFLKEELGIPRVLMWYDMFKDTNSSVLQEYGMRSLVEPVIWRYFENVMESQTFPPEMFQRFREVFPTVWAGSAFKGANGPSQTFLNVSKYLRNHLSWLDLIRLQERNGTRFGGIILTGWQRFDHFGSLCELLPASIPSLAADLTVVKDGKYKIDLLERVQLLLKCSEEAADNRTEDVFKDCHFPGSRLWDLVNELKLVRDFFEKQENSDEMAGWLSPYNVKHKYGSVYFAEEIFNRSQAMIQNMTVIGDRLKKELEEIFFKDTVQEWLFANVQYYLDKLRILSRSALEIAHTIYFRNRPLDEEKLDF